MDIVELKEDLTGSPLYSADLAPVPVARRTWNMWNLAALWVGMAVCIPTYLLASYMIRAGVSWPMALLIIGVANAGITIPMILNGHAGVKYGVPFPVLGRAAFGSRGIHLPALVRAIVACGWFGVQTWIGGLAFYSIWNAATGQTDEPGLNPGEFVCFGLFWLLNIYFIWKGTESIKWLENLSAPILILIGVALIAWSAGKAGSFGAVLDGGEQLQRAAVELRDVSGTPVVYLNPLRDAGGQPKVAEFQLSVPMPDGTSKPLGWNSMEESLVIPDESGYDKAAVLEGTKSVEVTFRKGGFVSSPVKASIGRPADESAKWWGYVLWLTAMVGFWATMSLSISDITRYAASQKDQVRGQFLGLPGTMILYSFVGIFVTCGAAMHFPDVLVPEDAPWDPVSLLARFDNPWVVILSQVFMIVATLTTNIAANVIAPANAFSNLFPRRLSFRSGGLVTGVIGIVICPWWLLNEISGILIFVSGLLGPVLGILLCDYYVIRKKTLNLAALYKTDGEYGYGGSHINPASMTALAAGVVLALVGYWVPALSFLYHLSWFTGVAVSAGIYYILMKPKTA